MVKKAKEVILSSICLVMSLTILLGLLCNVLELSAQGVAMTYDNGYTLLSFKSIFFDKFINQEASGGWVEICGVVNLFILLCGIAALVISVISFIRYLKNNGKFALPIIVIVIAACTSVFYMIEGLVSLSILRSMSVYDIPLLHTASFVPLIVQVVLITAYILCLKLIPEKGQQIDIVNTGVISETLNSEAPKTSGENETLNKKARKTSGKSETVNREVINMENQIYFLKQYKELLDSGVITQEEYDEKKKELL